MTTELSAAAAGAFPAAGGRRARRDDGFLTTPLGESPWRVRDLVGLLTRMSIGLVVLVVAWVGASGTVRWRDQLLWTAAGTAGVALTAASGAVWLLAGFGMVSLERRDVHDRLSERITAAVDAHGDDSMTASTYAWVAGMRFFHSASCDLVRAKELEWASHDEHAERGRRPCPMCMP